MRMAMDCIFCKIAAGKIPATLMYEDEKVVAFPDINPKTPVHVLTIPRKHITSLATVKDEETPIVVEMTRVANKLAREKMTSPRAATA